MNESTVAPVINSPSVYISRNESGNYSVQDAKSDGNYSSEKMGDSDSGNEKIGVDDESTDQEALIVNGEPVIQTGLDIAKYAIDLRDDNDPSLTFRSIVLGSMFAALGATLSQVR